MSGGCGCFKILLGPFGSSGRQLNTISIDSGLKRGDFDGSGLLAMPSLPKKQTSPLTRTLSHKNVVNSRLTNCQEFRWVHERVVRRAVVNWLLKPVTRLLTTCFMLAWKGVLDDTGPACLLSAQNFSTSVTATFTMNSRLFER